MDNREWFIYAPKPPMALFKENTELKEELSKKDEKLRSLENTNKELREKSGSDNSDRELSRLKAKFGNYAEMTSIE